MKYRIRLWDFDGTLADTGRDVWNSIQYAAKKCGGEIDRDYMKMTVIWENRWQKFLRK